MPTVDWGHRQDHRYKGTRECVMFSLWGKREKIGRMGQRFIDPLTLTHLGNLCCKHVRITSRECTVFSHTCKRLETLMIKEDECNIPWRYVLRGPETTLVHLEQPASMSVKHDPKMCGQSSTYAQPRSMTRSPGHGSFLPYCCGNRGILDIVLPEVPIYHAYLSTPASFFAVSHSSCQQKFRESKQELEVQFDVKPAESTGVTESNGGTVPPCPQCTPPPADAIALLNSSEVRAVASEASSNGGGTEGAEGGDGGDGQKVTPWEVEVRGACPVFCSHCHRMRW